LYFVIGGPSSKKLAKKIASKLDAKYIDSKLQIFPDGESKITITKKSNKGTVIVVQSTYPPVDSNLIQALTLISKAKQTSSKVIAVIPYLCYMRQDLEFLPGEVITSVLVAKLLKAAGADEIITVDIHSKLAMNYFEIPIKNISAVPKLASYFRKLRLRKPIVVAPDLFWADMAKDFANIIGAKSLALNKRRDRKTGALMIINTKKIDLSGRDVILLDDMVSTGASIVKATEYVKEQNCSRIFVACTHPLFVDDAQKRIKKTGVARIISTNTIPHKTNVVDVSDLIVSSIIQQR
jgi:ribose-phosphate pyrophosphokinase